MNKRYLFGRLSVLLICFFLNNQFTFAANEGEQSFDGLSLVVIICLILLYIPVFLQIKKLQKQLISRFETMIDEKEQLQKLGKEVEWKEKELAGIKDELVQLRASFAQSNEELRLKAAELKDTATILAGNKKELEQMLVAKIKENDTIQREAAEKRIEAERKIREAGQIHDTFFIETIHEMRTPLSLVLGSLALVVQNKEEGKDMSTHLLSAYRNTLAMQDLADQLIGTRRASDIASYLRIARYNIVEIVRQSCDLFVDWVAMNNVDFRINPQAPALWVWIDRRKMEFALRMLLTNAFKNTFSYGKVMLDISVIREAGKAYCALVLKDEGLDEDENARRGLKQIIDLASDIDGIYRCDSDKNGTSYSILIPLGKQHLLDRQVEFVEPEADLVKLTDHQKEEIAELIRIIPQKKETGKKLLVIDDSDQIRWFLKHVFAKEYQILEASNGQEGIDVALEKQPDLILCDVMMPVKNGFEACKELKSNERTAHTPVVMLTAKVESEDVITGIEAGADDYITKPFDIEILRSKINSLMKKRDEMKRYFTPATLATGSGPIDLPSNPFMDAVVKNIEKHLDDSTFEAKILADSLNMSLPTLYRKIKQYSDLSILELTRNIRLKKAAQLLASQQHSVQEVAEMVGFNDTATFRKRFTEQYNVTPSQYGIPV